MFRIAGASRLWEEEKFFSGFPRAQAVWSLLKMPQAGNVHRLAEHKNHTNTDRGAESVRMCRRFGDCVSVGSDQYEDNLNMRWERERERSSIPFEDNHSWWDVGLRLETEKPSKSRLSRRAQYLSAQQVMFAPMFDVLSIYGLVHYEFIVQRQAVHCRYCNVTSPHLRKSKMRIRGSGFSPRHLCLVCAYIPG
jgi:hypothetical protein